MADNKKIEAQAVQSVADLSRHERDASRGRQLAEQMNAYNAAAAAGKTPESVVPTTANGTEPNDINGHDYVAAIANANGPGVDHSQAIYLSALEGALPAELKKVGEKAQSKSV